MVTFKRAILLLVFGLYASTGAWEVWGTTNFVPVGNYITYEEKAKRWDEYPSEVTRRADEIALRLRAPHAPFGQGVPLRFQLEVINRARQNVTIWKPDSTQNEIGINQVWGDVQFEITPLDPTVQIHYMDRGPLMAISSVPTSPIEDFTTLLPGEAYQMTFTLPELDAPLPPGQYRVYAVYHNWRFGADGPAHCDCFLDFHAWVGEAVSNELVFEVVPPFQPLWPPRFTAP